MINQYSMNPRENITLLKSLLAKAGEGVPIAACLSEYKKPFTVKISKDGEIIKEGEETQTEIAKDDDQKQGKQKK